MLLSKHPEVVQYLREEHDAVFGKGIDETMRNLEATPSKLNDLAYTDAVIRETLRLFPVGFGIKKAPAGFVLPPPFSFQACSPSALFHFPYTSIYVYTDRPIPPPSATITYQNRAYPIDDLVVVPALHTLHYNAAYFPSPSSFRPERFLAHGTHPLAATAPSPLPTGTAPEGGVPRAWFRSFSRGARACLGQNLAMDEMRVVLLMVVRDFDFACADLAPSAAPRTAYTDLDTVLGDVVFQELAIEARPRGNVMMTVKESGYGKA
jgi:hypothetical protein